MDNHSEIDFIARRYKPRHFSPDAGWRRLGITPVSAWKRFRAAAVVTVAVVLSAAATVLYKGYAPRDTAQPAAETIVAGPMTQVMVINFENAPLSEVVAEIEDVYGVKVDNLPSSAADYSLSLHYEGKPADLIAIINDILGTDMTVREK